ncbi:uncharacterized protein LOC128667259 [Microplitis demolitor]|uniref:uncharacterized protein LOC128667259 n=1 Tax=Microplitis demolitor TaxID=69319 RepID=UPI00235B5C0B|nr:uncharacterized protein LOC128667259 [Microplitis demolitor]
MSSKPDQNGNRQFLKNITNFDEPRPLTMRLMQDSRKKDDEIKILKRQNQEYRIKVAFYHQTLRQQQQQQQQQQHQDRYYYLEHDTFHVRYNIYIPSSVSRKAFDAINPSKFIKIMSHAIWGEENISKLVVRKQKNTGNREKLDDRRLELIRAVNTYLDRAIQSAKKKFDDHSLCILYFGPNPLLLNSTLFDLD